MLSQHDELNVVLQEPADHEQQVENIGTELQKFELLTSLHCRPPTTPEHCPFCHAHFPLMLLQRFWSGIMPQPASSASRSRPAISSANGKVPDRISAICCTPAIHPARVWSYGVISGSISPLRCADKIGAGNDCRQYSCGMCRNPIG